MAHTKILIDYMEYERLQNSDRKYNELMHAQNHSDSHQHGEGQNMIQDLSHIVQTEANGESKQETLPPITQPNLDNTEVPNLPKNEIADTPLPKKERKPVTKSQKQLPTRWWLLN